MLVNELDVNKLTRGEALKRLAAKSQGQLIEYPDGRIYRNDELIAEEPTEEQLRWYEGKMRTPARCWERWFVGQYFTEEQKKELGLTDEDIAGKRIK